MAFGPRFPTANNFSWVGIDLYIGNRLQETQPNQILRKHRKVSRARYVYVRGSADLHHV